MPPRPGQTRPVGGPEYVRGRHPRMPVRTVALDRSNKWDHLRQVRLSAAWQTCTVLSARLSIPWVFQLGSRGNPARLSNTAGDACGHCTPNFLQLSPDWSDCRLRSQFELLSFFQRRFDPLAQRLDAV